jgi:nitrite reductase/ring-hydroxylating ferredoxin subunit
MREPPGGLSRHAGRIGLMDEFCAHRGVSLYFGRNEDNGLRCRYHGWKYDVTIGKASVARPAGAESRRDPAPGDAEEDRTH